MKRAAVVAACVVSLLVGVVGCGGGGGAGGGADNSPQAIKKRGVITVGMAVDPPFVLQRANGDWYSFNPQLVEDLGKYMGIKVKFVATGAATMVAGLQSGKYDILGSSVSATPERKKAIDFTKPYAYGGTSWIVQSSSPYHTTKDLNNSSATIAYNSNTFQGEITDRLMPKAHDRALTNASYADLISELSSGHSNAISVPSFLALAITRKVSGTRAVPPGTAGVDPTPVAWGVRKSDTKLRDYLNKFIAKAHRDGTIDRLMKQYITVENALKG